MSLLVVGNQSPPSPLIEDLDRLGIVAKYAADPQDAIDRCANGMADVMLVFDDDFAMQASVQFPSVSVVLATSDHPPAEDMLDMMRAGLADIWFDDQAPEVTRDRMEAMQQRANAASLELRTRINQYESELKRDQRAGRYIQLGMLPPTPMMIDDYRLQQQVVPSHMLSGDFVDYFAIRKSHFAAYVADVSGHGASSAFVTVLLKNFSRRIRREYHPSMLDEPGLILEWLNRELSEQHIDKHVAMILVVADVTRHRYTIVNAGHYPAAILVSGGQARFVENAGKPVGLFPEVHYEAVSVSVDVDDRLVVFSDGVLEMLDEPDHDSREQRLLAAAQAADNIADLWQILGVDTEGAAPDDMTCLILGREP